MAKTYRFKPWFIEGLNGIAVGLVLLVLLGIVGTLDYEAEVKTQEAYKRLATGQVKR